MSKLPAEFVKAPATATQPKPRPRRMRKASLISPEPVKDPRELLLMLTEEEYKALDEARQQLHQAGAEVTLEQMIHRVFAEWMVRARAAAQPQHATDSVAAPRDERMITRLRAFVAAPLRTWRELATQMLRSSYQRRS
jgi:hypothetical protein